MKEDERIVGVAGLHVLGEDLAEIRSLVVSHTYAGKGIGRMLVNHVMEEATKINVRRVISLTYETVFFQKCGFDFINKESLPEKVWIDCDIVQRWIIVMKWRWCGMLDEKFIEKVPTIIYIYSGNYISIRNGQVIKNLNFCLTAKL